MSHSTLILIVAGGALTGILTGAAPVLADEKHCAIDWHRLNLTPQQSQSLQALEEQWNRDYIQLQPSIVEDQRRLTRLLAEPRSDGLEIMALQQSLARKKEQLRSAATANYLRKRQLLNNSQQQGLEDMVHQVVAERQRTSRPGSSDEMPDRIQNLLKRVQTIWTKQNEP